MKNLPNKDILTFKYKRPKGVKGEGKNRVWRVYMPASARPPSRT
jgi:hypothetical protein